MERALLIATGYHKNMEPLLRYRPTPLLNIADKPILFYIIEALFREGIRRFDLVLSHLPAAIEEMLEDGRRWGITITYHLAKDESRPFAPLLPCLVSWDDSPIVFGLGDCLPAFKPDSLKYNQLQPYKRFYYPSDEWSGWAIFDLALLKTLNKKATLIDIQEACNTLPKTLVETLFSTQSYQDLKFSNSKAIKEPHELHLFPVTAHKVAPGVWISRNVSLHPHVKLNPPVFIGENCQIESGVQLGPDTVIENHCLVSSGSKIENSILFQGSYVGEHLEINNSIIDRNLLINLSYETFLLIREDFILSELNPMSLIRYPLRIFARLVALLALIFLSPLYIYLAATCQLIKKPMVYLPAPDDPAQWRTFNWLSFNKKNAKSLNAVQEMFKRLPLLYNVFKGDAHFVGVVPRTVKDLKCLPRDWQKLYLKSKVGLITLSDLDHGPHPTQDELYAAETFYSTQISLWLDIKLFLRWLIKKIIKLQKKND